MPQTIGRIPNRNVSITSVTREYLEVPSKAWMQTPAIITTPNAPRSPATTTCSFSLPVIGYPSAADAYTSLKAANVDEAREQCEQLKSCCTASRHWIPAEYPEEVNKSLLDFLKCAETKRQNLR